MNPVDAQQDSIARTFLNDAELQLESLPGTLQELIDALPDHNQQMLDAVRANNPKLHDDLAHVLASDQPEAAHYLVNALFDRVESLLESSAS